MEFISAFDMLKVGIGPSSSHTLGPWKAANIFINYLHDLSIVPQKIKVNLYGSLSLTGRGHCSDIAVALGLSGIQPESVDTIWLENAMTQLKENCQVELKDGTMLDFDLRSDIVFNKTFLKTHPNALKFSMETPHGEVAKTFYSIGGGFIKEENEIVSRVVSKVPFPIISGQDLLNYTQDKLIWEVVNFNELALISESEIDAKINLIWKTMLDSIKLGCQSSGYLPGGLNVKRRAFDMYQSLNGPNLSVDNDAWLFEMRKMNCSFNDLMNWISCFALAVNEVNAAMGKIVTAPTNGSAGVIPAVLTYYLVFENKDAGFEEIKRFLLVAAELGSIFKKGATISAAMGGCQAEIGVSSAMAAGALAELMGASPATSLMAAEIAMEHHLGLTCDPVGGLVQIPCIERNAMGAIKAINAANLALKTKAEDSKVSLDKVIATMWNTAKDMNSKYKETSEGGLALQVNLIDC